MAIRLRRAGPLLAAALLPACRPGGVQTTSAPSGALAVPARGTPAFPADWRFRPGAATAAFGERGMVSGETRLADEAGAEIMRRGGNAVDAAVAVGYALAVTYPVAGNLGGGGFMVVRMADGRTAAIDYREVAPLAATRNMYLDERGEPTDKIEDKEAFHLLDALRYVVVRLKRGGAAFDAAPSEEARSEVDRAPDDVWMT